MNKIVGSIMSISALILIPACAHKTQKFADNDATRRVTLPTPRTPEKTSVKTNTAPEGITLWLHGTKFLLPIDTHMHACPPGLHKVTDLPGKFRIRTLITDLSSQDPINFPLETFYSFGWSGDLDFKARELEAREIYAAIDSLVKNFETTYHRTPKITIITHSHGGNVALNLAKVKDPRDTWRINKLILLACPVQEQTKQFAGDPLFEKVYSLYSRIDSIQVLDPQGFYKKPHKGAEKAPLFSQRRFPASANLSQAQLRINGLGVLHLGFITRGFMNKLPSIIREIDTWELQSPGATTSEHEAILAISYSRATASPDDQA